jgi:membrane-associated phospholipid phosphatase
MDRGAIAWPNVSLAKKSSKPFPASPWEAQYYAIVVLGEFVQQGGWDKFEQQLLAILEAADVASELAQLAALVDYRGGVLSEALLQVNGIDNFFRGILSFTPGSHPATYGLVLIALRVGEFQVMHYKARFDRPRASTLSPLLMPPIEVPGHAAFPSGHSTQAHLVALCLAEVMPAAMSKAANPATGNADPALGPLQRMAERIARNREVLGMHYPSDSAAGKLLAELSCPLLMKCKTVSTLVERAQSEWQ